MLILSLNQSAPITLREHESYMTLLRELLDLPRGVLTELACNQSEVEDLLREAGLLGLLRLSPLYRQESITESA